MKIASQEIRTLAIKAYDSGVPPQQIAETLGYHLNAINRWLRAYQTEGRVEALPRGHRISMFSAEERNQLVELLEKRPNITLDEIRTHFGKQCSLNAVHKIVKALGFVFKKTLRAKEQDRADIVHTRQRWKIFQQNKDMKHLVFLDESGVRNNMTRRYGRARGGSRCCDAVIAGRVLSMTIVSSIRLDGTTESFVFEGALTKTIFEVYVQKILAPSLREGDIVIMDNLSSHKSQVAEEVIRSRKAEVLFLPAYSPGLNPIEKMWSKVKQLLRGIRAKTTEEIYSGIKRALSTVSARDAQGWFISCGYKSFQS